MRNWITKYRGESVDKDLQSSTDDATDPRELAKWYQIWRIVFHSCHKPVPSPCKLGPHFNVLRHTYYLYATVQEAYMCPGDLNLERLLSMFHDMVETQVDQNQSPPVDKEQQLEYYKDALRKTWRIVFPESDRRQFLEPGPLAEVRVVSTLTDFTPNTFPLHPDNPVFTPSASSNQKELRSAGFVKTSVSSFENQQFHRSFPSTITALSPGPSIRSPCSVETCGAMGEFPKLTAPVNGHRDSRQGYEATSPQPHRATNYQFQSFPSSYDSGVGSEQNIVAAPHTAIMNSMEPPPRLIKSSGMLSSRNIGQEALQHCQTPEDDFAFNSIDSVFPSNDTSKILNFTGLLNDQGSSRWQDIALTQGQAHLPVCSVCKGMRRVSINSQMQECLSCPLFYNLQN